MSEQAEATQTKSLSEMSLDELRAANELAEAELAESQKELDTQHFEASFPRDEQGRFVSGSELQKSSAARHNLIREYEHLAELEHYTDEYRAERAWEAYDKAKPVIEDNARKVREQLLKSAEHYERMSIPFPSGQESRTDDVAVLGLTQHERSRIMARLDSPGAKEKPRNRKPGEYDEDKIVLGKDPREDPSMYDTLREEYARGMKLGGVQGAAVCRAALQIAEDEGGVDAVVGEHRSEYEQDYLRMANDARVQAHNIYTRVPLPVYPRPGGARNPGEAGSRSRSALGLPRKGYASSGPLFPNKQKRRPAWRG